MKKKIVNITKNVLFLLFYVWVTLCGVIGFVAELVLKPFAKLFDNLLKERKYVKETIERVFCTVLLALMFLLSLFVVLLHPIGMAIVAVLLILLRLNTSDPNFIINIHIMWLTSGIAFFLHDIMF